jgi:homocysteine S-methyltransferase
MNTNQRLPHQSGGLYLADGGLETTLIFHEGTEVPYFASIDRLRTPEGTAQVRRYYDAYAQMASDSGLGFILETPTWRGSRDWGERLGYTLDELRELNHRSVDMMRELRDAFGHPEWVISGCIGPRGDGYSPESAPGAEEAERYHAQQIGWLAEAGVEMVSAYTMNTVAEAVGVTRAAQGVGVPVVISFTVETDARLPSGASLQEAIGQTDAQTGSGPAYYMVNCAHPTHFESVLDAAAPWTQRIQAIRANASTKSHAELDESTELDAGDPHDFGARMAALAGRLPHLRVLGGCCGTDLRHIQSIADALHGTP